MTSSKCTPPPKPQRLGRHRVSLEKEDSCWATYPMRLTSPLISVVLEHRNSLPCLYAAWWLVVDHHLPQPNPCALIPNSPYFSYDRVSAGLLWVSVSTGAMLRFPASSQTCVRLQGKSSSRFRLPLRYSLAGPEVLMCGRHSQVWDVTAEEDRVCNLYRRRLDITRDDLQHPDGATHLYS